MLDMEQKKTTLLLTPFRSDFTFLQIKQYYLSMLLFFLIVHELLPPGNVYFGMQIKMNPWQLKLRQTSFKTFETTFKREKNIMNDPCVSNSHLSYSKSKFKC